MEARRQRRQLECCRIVVQNDFIGRHLPGLSIAQLHALRQTTEPLAAPIAGHIEYCSQQLRIRIFRYIEHRIDLCGHIVIQERSREAGQCIRCPHKLEGYPRFRMNDKPVRRIIDITAKPIDTAMYHMDSHRIRSRLKIFRRQRNLPVAGLSSLHGKLTAGNRNPIDLYRHHGKIILRSR